MIAPRTSVAARPHRVTFQNPGPVIADGDGGYTQTWFDLAPPSLSVEIKPATASDLEHLAAGTVVSMATHVITGPFHPQVSTKSRVLFNGQSFSVTGVSNPEERSVDMVLVCVEVVA
ncbi:MAG: phage head closure protein [Vicinamibacterales bacterium]